MIILRDYQHLFETMKAGSIDFVAPIAYWGDRPGITSWMFVVRPSQYTMRQNKDVFSIFTISIFTTNFSYFPLNFGYKFRFRRKSENLEHVFILLHKVSLGSNPQANEEQCEVLRFSVPFILMEFNRFSLHFQVKNVITFHFSGSNRFGSKNYTPLPRNLALRNTGGQY